MHAICESGEYFATLVDSEANDQDTVLGLCEQLAQYNTGVSRRAGEIGPARYQVQNGGIAARPAPPLVRR